VSGDYSPSNGQWIIGDSSIMAHAVGQAPFKDVSTILAMCVIAFWYMAITQLFG